MDGWVKLYRKSLQWEWYKKPHMFHLFSHLVMTANHEDARWQGIEVKRGQLITGRKILSDATGISQQTIRTCLARLEQTGEINQQVNQLFRIITINNYDEYQADCKKSTSESTNHQPTINQPSTTNKKEKKEKNKDMCKSLFLSFYENYPKKKAKADAEKAFIALSPDEPTMQRIMAALESQKESADWLKENGRYIPLPATWLRGRRWEDQDDNHGEEWQ